MNSIIILGPTGVGKSSIAVELAKKINGEIISSDSIQIYKELNIGSGKITEQEKQNIPHHCIDILEPNQEFSVAEYVELTRKKILEISSRGKTPIIVGGTGLYVTSLVNNYDFFNTNKSNDIRQKYEKIVKEFGSEYLYNLLIEKYPEYISKINANDKFRIIRAFEIKENDKHNNHIMFECDYLIFGIYLENREKLYEKINNRVDTMLNNGLIEEVKYLVNKYGIDCPSFKGIGYKEIVEYLNNKCSKEEAINSIKQHSRNYAKRQLTWMRGMKDQIIWEENSNQNATLEKILNKYKETIL